MAVKKRNLSNIAALLLVLVATAYFVYALLEGDHTIFLPGKTTSGHHQIEEKCDLCHGEPFAGRAVIDTACKKCHSKELKAANDSHPITLFADPRFADLLSVLDARSCVICHREHKPDITHAMGVTVPVNNCLACHKDIAQERPTHQKLSYATCDSAGCHNYHDNRALYEEFLLKHQAEPNVLPGELTQLNTPKSLQYKRWLSAAAPTGLVVGETLQQQWQHSAHGQNQITCGVCHSADAASKSGWLAKPNHETCKRCHPDQVEGFLLSKYGMRLAEQLPPMTVGAARVATREEVKHVELSCTICHQKHKFDTQQAAVESCLSCHNDQHSLAYKSSPHYGLWQAELDGTAPAGSGVSCATCHMPRQLLKTKQGNQVVSQHNLNENLRPNEKMLRDTCMACHGLGFSIDALADTNLIARNFDRVPAVHVKSIEMSKTHKDSRIKRP